MLIRNRLKAFSITLVTSGLVLSGCSSGSSNSSNNGGNSNNGDASKLELIAPKTMYSLPTTSGTGYIVVNNPTEVAVKNLHYKLTKQLGSGAKVEIDPLAAAKCSLIESHSSCNLKVAFPAGSVAGSIGLAVDNLNLAHTPDIGGIELELNNLNANLKNRSAKATGNNLAFSGIEQAAYNELSGADGITLSYYNTVISGTPYVLVSGLVASSNAGDFNDIVLVDNRNNPIPNQQLINENINFFQGSTFYILLALPTADKITQEIKVQTRKVIAGGETSIVSTAKTTSKLTTTSNMGITEILPSVVYLTSEYPEQIITLVNNGDANAQLESFTSTNPNIDVRFSPESLASGGVKTAVLKLKNISAQPADGSLILEYNNGQSKTISQIKVEQNVTPSPTPGITSPKLILESGNSIIELTTPNSVEKILTLSNIGNGTASSLDVKLDTSFGSLVKEGKLIVKPSTKCGDLAPNDSCQIELIPQGVTIADSGQIALLTIGYKDSANNQQQISYPIIIVGNSSQISSLVVPHGDINYPFELDGSAYELVRLKNSGASPTKINSIRYAGTGAKIETDNSLYGVLTRCQDGNSLAAGSECYIGMKIDVDGVGEGSGTLSLTYTPSNSAEHIDLFNVLASGDFVTIASYYLPFSWITSPPSTRWLSSRDGITWDISSIEMPFKSELSTDGSLMLDNRGNLYSDLFDQNNASYYLGRKDGVISSYTLPSTSTIGSFYGIAGNNVKVLDSSYIPWTNKIINYGTELLTVMSDFQTGISASNISMNENGFYTIDYSDKINFIANNGSKTEIGSIDCDPGFKLISGKNDLYILQKQGSTCKIFDTNSQGYFNNSGGAIYHYSQSTGKWIVSLTANTDLKQMSLFVDPISSNLFGIIFGQTSSNTILSDKDSIQIGELTANKGALLKLNPSTEAINILGDFSDANGGFHNFGDAAGVGILNSLRLTKQ